MPGGDDDMYDDNLRTDVVPDSINNPNYSSDSDTNSRRNN